MPEFFGPLSRQFAAEKLSNAGIPSKWLLRDDEQRRFIVGLSECSLRWIYIDDYNQNVTIRNAWEYILATKQSLEKGEVECFGRGTNFHVESYLWPRV